MPVKHASKEAKSSTVFAQTRKPAEMFRVGMYTRRSALDQQTLRYANPGDGLQRGAVTERRVTEPYQSYSVDYLQVSCYTHVGYQMKTDSIPEKADVLQGTLVLLVLRTLDALGALHGYGIARRIEQVSRDLLRLNQGTLYPALLRMEQEGWIVSHWGTSENNRKARFYSISTAGRRQLARETKDWQRMSSTIERFLGPFPSHLTKDPA
jgi:PadR family transcriptional regulator PadR